MALYTGNLGGSGGAGGAGSTAAAITRLNVIDPHIVQMVRDVMSFSDQAYRLKSCGGAAGGGGGGLDA